MNEAEYDAAKPAPPKPAWWHEMLASAPKTDLDKAKAMLRQAFVIQPLLTIWFTSEQRHCDAAKELEAAGYLHCFGDPIEGFDVYDITPKAFAELRDPQPIVPRR